jgi:hypothetical protein
MPPRQWSPPAPKPSGSPAAGPTEASTPSRREWGVVEWLVSFVYCMLFFGIIAGVAKSRFPIDLGLFLFFTNEGLIEWVLRKVGIRLVPDSVGATFVKTFVWMAGLSILLPRWRDSTPAWLSPLLPPDGSWSVIATAALGFAVLVVVATMIVRRMLPWFGIEIARDSLAWTMTEAVVVFAMLGLVLLLLSTPLLSDWR